MEENCAGMKCVLEIKILKYNWSERKSNQLHSRKFSVEFYYSWEILSD